MEVWPSSARQLRRWRIKVAAEVRQTEDSGGNGVCSTRPGHSVATLMDFAGAVFE